MYNIQDFFCDFNAQPRCFDNDKLREFFTIRSIFQPLCIFWKSRRKRLTRLYSRVIIEPNYAPAPQALLPARPPPIPHRI